MIYTAVIYLMMHLSIALIIRCNMTISKHLFRFIYYFESSENARGSYSTHTTQNHNPSCIVTKDPLESWRVLTAFIPDMALASARNFIGIRSTSKPNISVKQSSNHLVLTFVFPYRC